LERPPRSWRNLPTECFILGHLILLLPITPRVSAQLTLASFEGHITEDHPKFSQAVLTQVRYLKAQLDTGHAVRTAASWTNGVTLERDTTGGRRSIRMSGRRGKVVLGKFPDKSALYDEIYVSSEDQENSVEKKVVCSGWQ